MGPRGLPGERGPRGLPGETGPRGLQGETGHVQPDWAAMALAAGSIPYVDAPISAGVGVGSAGGTPALAFGIAIRLTDHSRATATLMRTSDETGVAAGLAFGF